MTKKTYPKTLHVSRSTPARTSRGYPFDRCYDALETDDPHPIDAIVDRIPKIAALDRRLIRLSKRQRTRARDVREFIDYEDARLEQRCERERVFFDAGHQQGRLDGAVDSSSSSVKLNGNARAFARRIQVARLSSRLGPEGVVAVLLELARGLVVAGKRRRRNYSSRARRP